MITFFRRALSSWIVLGLLGLIMIAFIVTGVGTPGGLEQMSGGASGDTIAKIGSQRLSLREVSQRARLAQQNAQAQNAEMTMANFVQQGGVEYVVSQLISNRALELWAAEQGFGSSKKLVDALIATDPNFQGPTGSFDEATFRERLAQRNLPEATFRQLMTGETIRSQVLMPVAAANRAPLGVAAPYAGLMLEARKGAVGVVPSALMPAGTPPTEADVNAWYSRNLVRYTMPERRVIRFALIGKDHLATLPKVTDAEIAAFYKANAANYGGSETRTLSQVILSDEAAARRLGAAVKGGARFADAAAKAGFSATDTALGAQTEAQIRELASAEVAKAAFAAPKGATTAPIKTALGWHILHVEEIASKAGRSLESVRGEISESLSRQKVDEAVTDLIATMEEEVSDGSSFDEVVKAHKLQAVTTPPVLANGTAPDSPGWQQPAPLQVLLKTAFDVSSDEDPTVETIGNGELHALLKVSEVIPAAPVPLARIRERVKSELMIDRAWQRARAVAKAIVAKVNAGIPLATAITEAKLNLPAPQPAGGRQLEILQSGREVPPPIAQLFNMKQGTARMLAAPNKQGWFIVKLDMIEKGDASKAPGLIESTRGQFNGMLAEEYTTQFSKAVEKAIKVTRNDAAINRLRRELGGAGTQ